MPCWLPGVERGRRDDTASTPRHLDSGRRHRGRGVDGHGVWRDRHTRTTYELRLADAVAGDDVPAVWNYADAAGSRQVAAQPAHRADEKILTLKSAWRRGST